MKKILYLIVPLIALSIGCTSRDWQSIDRSLCKQKGHYIITKYSGGQTVFTDTFYGTINQESGTDGIYYIKGDTLVEIAGDYVIKQTKF
jgi:hypothetical protein